MKPKCEIIKAVEADKQRRDDFFAFICLLLWIAGAAVALAVQAERLS